MEWTGRYLLIISEGVLKNGSDVFNILDPDTGGADTFRVPLSSDGGATLTHYAAYTPLSPETRNALLYMSTQEFKAYVDQLAIERGREPVGSITAFKGSLLMSEEDADPWAYIAAQGMERYVTEPV